MGHNLAGLGTASLDTFGGLITFARPEDVPEGASPRNWDVDFIVGSVFTRAGLSSVYTFTNSLTITQVVITYGVGTFTYTGTKGPVVNEGFLLSGFTDSLSFLNGQTVFVTFVEPSANTFLADVESSDIGPIQGLNATASSTTGEFTGPNIGNLATVVSSNGNPWSNPNGILGNLTYASAVTGSSSQTTATPGAAANQGAGTAWSNPSNILLTGASVASVNLVAPATSATILANAIGLNLPVDATVTGIKISESASSTAPAGTASLTVQLATNGFPIGTAVKVPISSSTNTYTQGSSSYQWGMQLTPTITNGSPLGILITGVLAAGGGSSSIQVNTLTLTVYYTTASGSEALQVTGFSFTVPSSSGISGFGTTFQAYSTASTVVTLQLLKNGLAVGTPKQQVLTTTPTIYSLGSAIDLWGSTWSFADVNNTKYGVQITASQLGTTFIRDLDVITYLTPTLSNFNYVKTFDQDNGQVNTLALDASGIMWQENVNDAPGVLSVALTGILPGSYAKSATANDQEYIVFSDLSVGTDRPRVWNGSAFTPLSQVGPGAPPAFSPATGQNGATTLAITAFSVSGTEVTFTFQAGPTVSADQIYQITGAVPSYLNIVGVVLGTPSPTGTTFVMNLPDSSHNGASGSLTAVGTLQFNYPITSITQFPSHPTNGTNNGGVFWGAGPGPTHSPGSNLVIYYSETEDTTLSKYFAANPQSTYVRLSAFNQSVFQPFDGTYLVTAVGSARPSSTAGANRFYFVVNVGVSGSAYPNGTTGTYQQTVATVTLTSPASGLNTGDSVQITGETPTAWNNTWSIVSAVKSSLLNITGTQLSSAGVATYQYSIPAGGNAPTNGQIATVTQCNNSAAGYTLSPFNTTGVIAVPGALGAGSFDISGFTAGLPVPFAAETPGGIAETFGTQFTIDPGALTVGTNQNPIYGNAGSSSPNGGLFIVGGSSVTPIGAGTRQAVVFFITTTGYETAPSPPVVFTVPSNTTAIHVTNIPIGGPNVIARGIAITEAGQNGVPGANFYVIPNPVTVQVQNGAPVTYTSTIINDNVTTSATFSFTDAVLLASTEVDVQGNDLFNLIELGSSGWCVPYASRMFYGLCLNKIDNFLNLSFDGGYLPSSQGGDVTPLGWLRPTTVGGLTLLNSPVTGQALYIYNNTGNSLASCGQLFQSAYLDAYQVPIIRPNTLYSIRIAAACPSGIQVGTLSVSLVDYDSQLGFGTVYGNFSVPLTSMTSNTAVFTGTILTSPFVNTVSTQLTLMLQVLNMGNGADCEIDRIELFPTLQPYLKAKVLGSYVNNLEAIDASGSGGIIDTESENPQACMGGFVMHNTLYLLKTNSMYSTQDTPTSEPGGWNLDEVSNKVGTIGISSYDTGEEWMVTACRPGIYGFNGGQPVKLMQEIWNVWEQINWAAGNSIVLRNDITNRRILCAIPLPTPNQWLPFDPSNPAPTTPNVILMCNYQGLNTFEELVNSPGVHTTMFGTLAAVDMKRKWSIWRISTPYMDFIKRANDDTPLFVCNGIQSSKIYQFLDDQLSDDGVAINGLYTTYGHVNAAKAATLPIFGFHTKRYTILQVNAHGAGSMKIRILPNTLDARYPYTVPGGVTLTDPAMDDYFRPLNVKAQRAFLEFSTDAVGSWMNVQKSLLTGKADPWSSLNPTGGGNLGIS